MYENTISINNPNSLPITRNTVFSFANLFLGYHSQIFEDMIGWFSSAISTMTLVMQIDNKYIKSSSRHYIKLKNVDWYSFMGLFICKLFILKL